MTHGPRLGKLNTCLLFCVTALCAIAGWFALGADSGTAANAPRGGGGISITAPTAPEPEMAPRFGNRTLKEGMEGDDVRVLKGIVRSKELLVGTLSTDFDAPTTDAVKEFQQDEAIKASGVVNKSTSKSLVRSMRKTEASWYGPGLYGNGVACGGTLRKGTIGVAHKTLPCGSKVMIGYHGRFLMAKVIDRGPYVKGRALDLTYAAAESLNFIDAGVANVHYAVVNRK